MTFYECHFTRERGYAPFPLETPPRPVRASDKPGCVNFKEKQDGRCRTTGWPCDAVPVATKRPTEQPVLLGGTR